MELWKCWAEKMWREWETREKAEQEAKEKAEWEAREQYKRDLEFHVKRGKEKRQRHGVVARRVTKAKLLQRQVRMPEASGSRRNGELDVRNPGKDPDRPPEVQPTRMSNAGPVGRRDTKGTSVPRSPKKNLAGTGGGTRKCTCPNLRTATPSHPT